LPPSALRSTNVSHVRNCGLAPCHQSAKGQMTGSLTLC
jgi:hypothetical protein